MKKGPRTGQKKAVERAVVSFTEITGAHVVYVNCSRYLPLIDQDPACMSIGSQQNVNLCAKASSKPLRCIQLNEVSFFRTEMEIVQKIRLSTKPYKSLDFTRRSCTQRENKTKQSVLLNYGEHFNSTL